MKVLMKSSSLRRRVLFRKSMERLKKITFVSGLNIQKVYWQMLSLSFRMELLISCCSALCRLLLTSCPLAMIECPEAINVHSVGLYPSADFTRNVSDIRFWFLRIW